MTEHNPSEPRAQWLLMDFFQDPDYVARALEGLERHRKGIPGISFEELLKRREAPNPA